MSNVTRMLLVLKLLNLVSDVTVFNSSVFKAGFRHRLQINMFRIVNIYNVLFHQHGTSILTVDW